MAKFLNFNADDVTGLHEGRGLHGDADTPWSPHEKDVADIKDVGLGEMFDGIKAVEDQVFRI